MTNKYTDHISNSIDASKDLLTYLQRERTQLYGTIIYLMELYNTKRVVMPSLESMREYIETYALSYEDEEDGFVVKLVDKETLDGEED